MRGAGLQHCQWAARVPWPRGHTGETICVASLRDLVSPQWHRFCPGERESTRSLHQACEGEEVTLLYALDAASLGLPRGAPRREVENAMRGHVLEQAELMGRYGGR